MGGETTLTVENAQAFRIEPTQLSAEYELVKERLIEALSARTTAFMTFEAFTATNEPPLLRYDFCNDAPTDVLSDGRTAPLVYEGIPMLNNASTRYVIVVLPARYEENTVLVNEITSMLKDLFAESVLVPMLLFDFVGFYCRETDPRNPYFQPTVECGASIGAEGKDLSGSFGGYLQDKLTGEIFGISCCHTFCANEPEMADATPEQLIKLIPEGTEILQPSPSDRQYRLSELKKIIPGHCDGEIIRSLREEQAALENGDHRFARLTSINELCVDKGILWDYMILSITNTDRRGKNLMQPLSNGPFWPEHLDYRPPSAYLEPPKTDLETLHDALLDTVGRTSGGSSTWFNGFWADVKLPRLSEPFRCRYAQSWLVETVPGDSGSLVRYNSEAIGLRFGGALCQAYFSQIRMTWIADLVAICERIKEKWGKDLVVYEGWLFL